MRFSAVLEDSAPNVNLMPTQLTIEWEKMAINISLIQFGHFKVGWVKYDQTSCLFLFISLYPEPE